MTARKPITAEREDHFIAGYVKSGGSFSAAVRAASPHLDQTTPSGNVGGHQSWRDHIARNLAFAERFQEAKQEVADELISIAHERIREGVKKPMLYKGRQGVTHDGEPAYEVKYSDQLLLAKLRALVADYRERTDHHHYLHHGDRWQISSADLDALTEDQLQTFTELLTVIRDHRQTAPAIEHQPDETDYVAAIEAELEEEMA